MPDKWRKGVIVKLPKKGDLRAWKNWRRGVILLPVMSKIMGHVIISRIQNGVETNSEKNKQDFRKTGALWNILRGTGE